VQALSPGQDQITISCLAQPFPALSRGAEDPRPAPVPVEDPLDADRHEGVERKMQMINFMNTLAIMGGLALFVGLGPGPLSIDRQRGGPPS
jgi:hypothetical protein